MAADDRDEVADLASSTGGFNRRGFLSFAAAAAAFFTASPALARLPGPERRLALLNPHSGERFTRAYWVQGEYVPEALQEINFLLRDQRSGRVTDMDPALLDTLYALRGQLGTSEPLQGISGYRTPETNAAARARSRAVARNSFHIHGMAVDIRVRGVNLAMVRRAAESLQAGGVGYYPRSDYIHIDVGPVRTWAQGSGGVTTFKQRQGRVTIVKKQR